MPDTVSSVATGWFPVLTAFVGACFVFITEWFRDKRTTEREHKGREEARKTLLFERRTTFQRQTLLDLQEVLMQLGRTTGQIHDHDSVMYRKTGKWQKDPCGLELAESDRLANARSAMLGVRVRDASIRELLQQFKDCCTAVTMSASPASSEINMRKIGSIFVTLNHRIGELLNKLDDDEDNMESTR